MEPKKNREDSTVRTFVGRHIFVNYDFHRLFRAVFEAAASNFFGPFFPKTLFSKF